MLAAVQLSEAPVVCAICQRPEDACDRAEPGAHIYDGIKFTWAVIAVETKEVQTFHFSKQEALQAMNT